MGWMIPRLGLLILAVVVPTVVAVSLGRWALRVPFAGLGSMAPLLMLAHRAIFLVSLRAVLLGARFGVVPSVRPVRLCMLIHPIKAWGLPSVLLYLLLLLAPVWPLRTPRVPDRLLCQH